MTTPMLERCARAVNPVAFRRHANIHAKLVAIGNDECTARRISDVAYGPEVERAREAARAVLTELLSPDEGMIEAGAHEIGEGYDGVADPETTPNNWSRATLAADAGFTAMIRNILGEQG